MKLNLILAAAALSLSAACDQDILTAERSTSLSEVGTVKEVDQDTRRFVVRTNAQTLTLRASDQVVNFDQIEVGDKIRLEYEESLAVGMADPSDDGEAVGASLEARAAEGDKPGIAKADIVSIVAQFIAYDTRDNSATIRLNNGEISRVSVAREMRAFAKARKPGDRITIVYERAVALFIEEVE